MDMAHCIRYGHPPVIIRRPQVEVLWRPTTSRLSLPSRRSPASAVSAVMASRFGTLRRALAKFRILKWRYVSTIYHISSHFWWGDVGRFPDIGPMDPYGTYLQFRFLKWPSENVGRTGVAICGQDLRIPHLHGMTREGLQQRCWASSHNPFPLILNAPQIPVETVVYDIWFVPLGWYTANNPPAT